MSELTSKPRGSGNSRGKASPRWDWCGNPQATWPSPQNSILGPPSLDAQPSHPHRPPRSLTSLTQITTCRRDRWSTNPGTRNSADHSNQTKISIPSTPLQPRLNRSTRPSSSHGDVEWFVGILVMRILCNFYWYLSWHGMGWIELHGSIDGRNLVVDRMHGVEWQATSGASNGGSAANHMGQLRQPFLVLCGACPC